MNKTAFILSIISISLTAALAVAGTFFFLTKNVVYIDNDRS
ncbi:MAG: hypothetical protein ACI4J4_01360 [Ruminiclostridium sp.]